MQESEAISQARRALGAELAAYRRAGRYSQAQLAALTDYSRSTVAMVETGRQHVPRDFWERADGVLKTGGVLALASEELEAAASRDQRVTARNLSKARRAVPLADDPDARPALRLGEVPVGPGGVSPSVLAHLGGVDPAALVHPLGADGESAADGMLGFVQSLQGVPSVTMAKPRQATAGDVGRLRSMRQHLKAIDNSHGGRIALPLTAWYLQVEVVPLLEGDDGRAINRALVELAAEFQHDAGWAAYDAGDQPMATRYFGYGLKLAHAAGSRLLSGRVLAAMSHQAIYLGQVRQAVEFASAARVVTKHVATPRTIAMLAAMQACAYAAAGESRSCRLALDEASNALTLDGTDQAEPEWLDFDEGGYWGHAARAHRDLGQYAEAERCARKSVGLCLPGHSRTRAQRTAIYATAYLRLGEVDAAAAAGEQLVRDAWNLQSGHVFGEVAQLRTALARVESACAADFLDQAHELLACRAPELNVPASQ